MPDPRVEQYARVMVETCLDVQPGIEVMVVGGIQGRPLLIEVAGSSPGRRLRPHAAALQRELRLRDRLGARGAARARSRNASPIKVDTMQRIDGLITIDAPENTPALTALTPSARRR